MKALKESILADMETTLKVSNKKALDAIIKLPKKSDFEKENILASMSGKRVYVEVLEWHCGVLISKYINKLQHHSSKFDVNAFDYLRFQVMPESLGIDFVDKHYTKALLTGLANVNVERFTAKMPGYKVEQLKTVVINICKKLRENPECIMDLINHANNRTTTKNIKEIFDV